MASVDDLSNRFSVKMKYGESLITSLEKLSNVVGISKLKKKIRQELVFLNKMLSSGSMKNEHLLSTNLHHFAALVSCIFESSDVVSVLETKSYTSQNGESKKLCIDIVCDSGNKWIKVIARNPKALSQILSGDGEYGQKSIVDHGIEHVYCAKQNHYMFKQPQVYFYFASGVTTTVRESLEAVEINLIGCDIDNCNDIRLATFSNSEQQSCHQNFEDCISDNNAITCTIPHDWTYKYDCISVSKVSKKMM